MDDYVDDENVCDNKNDIDNLYNKNEVDNYVDRNEEFCPKVPQICLLEVQSSTESDKTTTTVFEQQLRALNSDCSLPSSPAICANSGIIVSCDNQLSGRK